jgi:hypothetical protein
MKMDSSQLKQNAEQILGDLEKSMNDMALMTDYMYDRKTEQRMERIYADEIEHLVHKRLKEFQDTYINRLNLLSEKALKEMTTPVKADSSDSSKIHFWSSVYARQPLELIIKKYLEAIDTHDQEFLDFFENNLIHSQKLKPYKERLDGVIKDNRKTKIQKSTQEEIKKLKDLYGFYLQSLEFTKHHGLDLSKIQNLFKSLDVHFKVPLKELLPHS